MKPKFKSKWLKALRSGRYRQADGSLKDEGAYCCLGVLCNVIGVRWRKHETESAMVPFIGGKEVSARDSDTGLLGAGLLRKVGMGRNTQTALALMNDEGKSFDEIADYIEKRL